MGEQGGSRAFLDWTAQDRLFIFLIQVLLLLRFLIVPPAFAWLSFQVLQHCLSSLSPFRLSTLPHEKLGKVRGNIKKEHPLCISHL